MYAFQVASIGIELIKAIGNSTPKPTVRVIPGTGSELWECSVLPRVDRSDDCLTTGCGKTPQEAFRNWRCNFYFRKGYLNEQDKRPASA